MTAFRNAARQPRPRPAELRLAAQRVQQQQPVPALHAADRAELPQPHPEPVVPDVPDPERRRGRPARRARTTTRPRTTSSPRCSFATRSATTARSRSVRPTSARASATSATRATISPSAIANNPGAPGDCANALASTGPVVNGVVTNPRAEPQRRVRERHVRLLAQRRPHRDRRGRQSRLREPQHQAHRRAWAASTMRRTSPRPTPSRSSQATSSRRSSRRARRTRRTPSWTRRRTSATSRLRTCRTAGRWAPRGSSTTALRADSFTVSSTQFASGFGQLSPRVKLTRFFGARNSVYAYYGRFFTPFSLENVSPLAAYTLEPAAAEQHRGVRPEAAARFRLRARRARRRSGAATWACASCRRTRPTSSTTRRSA